MPFSFPNEQESRINSISFNQDQSCFSCATDTGFLIYSVNPFIQNFRREFSSGALGIVEMLFRSNLLAIVGLGDNLLFPSNKVMIWDDPENQRVGELSFASEVLAVKLRRDAIIVVLESKILVYNFANLKLLHTIITIPNKKGLVAVCSDPSNFVLACPSHSRGCIRVELFYLRKSTMISAHESELAQITLNSDGTRLATASDRGTLIRIFDTISGLQLQELRRGSDNALVNSIAFSRNSNFLACTSDRGTAHVWVIYPSSKNPSLAESDQDGSLPENTNKTRGLSFLRNLLPKSSSQYISSEWSFAQYHGIESNSICTFASDYNLAIVSPEGSFRLVNFSSGGECEQINYAQFLRNG